MSENIQPETPIPLQCDLADGHACPNRAEVKLVRSWEKAGLSSRLALNTWRDRWSNIIVPIILTAALGFVGYVFLDAKQSSSDDAAFRARVASIEKNVDRIERGQDRAGPIAAQMARLAERVEGLSGTIDARLQGIETRLSNLEAGQGEAARRRR